MSSFAGGAHQQLGRFLPRITCLIGLGRLLEDVRRVRAQHDHAEHHPTITPRSKNLVVGAAAPACGQHTANGLLRNGLLRKRGKAQGNRSPPSAGLRLKGYRIDPGRTDRVGYFLAPGPGLRLCRGAARKGPPKLAVAPRFFWRWVSFLLRRQLFKESRRPPRDVRCQRVTQGNVPINVE
jgi:hypothetical protein